MASIGRDGDADALLVGEAAAAATEAYGNISSGGTAAVGADGSDTCCSSTYGCSGERHPRLPRGVVEGCGGRGRGIGGGTCSSAGDRRYCFPYCVGGSGGQGARFCRWNSGNNGGSGERRYCSLRCISWGGARVVSCSSGISGNIGGGTGDQRYCSLGASIRGAVGARESSAGAVSSDATAEAAASTGGTAAPVASAAKAARALASSAGSAGGSWLGNICGERGASTHPFVPGTVFPLEVRYYNGSWLQQ